MSKQWVYGGDDAKGETIWFLMDMSELEADIYKWLQSEGECAVSPTVSLKPSDAVQGGGFDNVDVTFKQVRTVFNDYNGTVNPPIPCLEVTMSREDGSDFTEHYSAGDAKNFVPSEDGRKFVSVGKQPGLGETTNTMILLRSIVNSGFPEDKVSDDVTVFEGMKAYMTRQAQKDNKGQVKKNKQGKDQTVLVVAKIDTMPWDNNGTGQASGSAQAQSAPASKAAKAGPVAVPTTGPVGPVAPGSAVWQKAAEGLVAILAGKGGSIQKAVVAQEAFKHFAKDTDRNAMVQLVYNDTFLQTPGQPWSYDGTTISLG